MSFPQFEGFRYHKDDKVIIKASNVEGRIAQRRHEIVSDDNGVYTIETNYQVKYGGYLSKTCKEDEIKYKLELEPESEKAVMDVFIDVELMREDFNKAREYDVVRSKLIGDIKGGI